MSWEKCQEFFCISMPPTSSNWISKHGSSRILAPPHKEIRSPRAWPEVCRVQNQHLFTSAPAETWAATGFTYSELGTMVGSQERKLYSNGVPYLSSSPHRHQCDLWEGKKRTKWANPLIKSSSRDPLLLLFSCSVMSDSATPWTEAHQASLSITISQRLLKLTSTETMMPFNYLILSGPLLLLPSIFSEPSRADIKFFLYWLIYGHVKKFPICGRFGSQIHPQYLAQFLKVSKHYKNICWMNEFNR